ncbi:ATP-binding protein [Streptomyces sp. NPDC002573]|uniref:ATP-binding protein n=1 Tax=Streptomyces sp. NPDC002573 TaxID=3364651 RepID=UPI0036AB3BE1
MSELSPPAPADAGRQDARHAARDKAADAYGLRRRLVRAVMVPTASEIVFLTAAVILDPAARLSVQTATWLAVSMTVVGGSILMMAYRHILSIARSVEEEDRLFGEWLAFLRKGVKTGSLALQEYAEAVRRGDRSAPPPAPALVEGSHTFAELARSFAEFQGIAVASVAQAMQQQHLAVFVNVARRLQSYCESAFSRLDPVLRDEEDPHRLTELYGVDHQITQIVRSAESMLVLGGDRSHRISQPVSIKAVLRHGIQEIQHFTRVQVTEAPSALLQGFAVKDVTHLLAELLENATRFSDQDVWVRAEHVPDGLLVEVDDRGLPMELAERRRLNTLLREPDQFDVAEHLVQDGRSGLFVVARLAQRHRIKVELLRNRYGSTQAAVVIPHALLAPEQAPLSAQKSTSDAPQGPAVSAAEAPIPGHVLLARGTEQPVAGPLVRRAVAHRPHLTVAEGEHPAITGAAKVSARTGSSDAVSGTPTDAVVPTPGRKPLPRRTGGHMAPQLQQASESEQQQTTHNPQLAADFARGFRAPVTDEGAERSTPLPAPSRASAPTHEEMS